MLLLAAVCIVCVFTACGKDKEDKITALSIVEGSIDTVVTEGEELDISSLKVLVTYESGKTATVSADKLTVTKPDTSTAGTKKLKVTYKGFSAEFDITVESAAPVITGISLLTDTVPAKVFVGQSIDLTAIKVSATYSDGTTSVISAENLEIETPVTSLAGTVTFAIAYGGKSVNATVSVIGVKEMLITGTSAMNLEVGDTPDYSSLSIVVTYTDDSTAVLSASDVSLTGIDTASPGEKSLSLTYLGVTVSASVYVDCVVSVTIQHLPAKVDIGAAVDTSAVTALVKWHSAKEEVILLSDLSLSVPETDSVGSKTVTAEYKGVEGTASVEVVGVSSITFSSILPVELKLGADFNPPSDTVVAVANMTDGTQRNLKISDLAVTGKIDTSILGSQSATVAYLDGSATYTVKVYGVKEITVDGASVDTTVTQGLKPDISGLAIYVVYDDIGATRVRVTEGFTTNFASLKFDDAEDDTLTVTYDMGAFGTHNATVTFSTQPPVVVSITATVSAGKDRIFKGATFDKSAVSVTATYNNNTAKPVTEFKVSTLDSSSAGKKTLTVTYGEGADALTAEIYVTVLEVTSVTVSGPTLIELGDSYDYSDLVVSAVISNGTGSETVTVPLGDYTVKEIDVSAMGDKSLSVIYQGVESAPLKVHVKGVSAIALSGVTGYVYILDPYDYSRINLYVTYSNGASAYIPITSEGVNITSAPDTSKKGTTTLAVEYKGATAKSGDITVREIVMLTIVSTSVRNEALMGESYDYSAIKVIVVYEDGDGNPLTGDNKTVDLESDPRLEVIPPDTATVGDKALTVKYKGIEKTIGVHVKDVLSITPITDSYVSSIKLGETPNLSGIRFIVDFTNGTQTEIGIESLDKPIDVSEITSATTGGVKKAKATYKGFTVEIEITVVKVGEGATEGEFIVGVALPDEILSHKGYSNNFKVKDEPYYVGSNNPYKFYLELVVLDANDKIVDRDGKSFSFSYDIKEIIDGAPTAIADLSSVVSVDGNSYQFTKAAEGRIFEITLTPNADNIIGTPEDLSASHTVKIVDAYNVYEAWELNYLSNLPVGADDLDGNNIPGVVDHRTAVNRYLNENHGVENPSAIIDFIKGMVIHGNLSITIADIPEEYICKTDGSGRPLSELVIYDKFGVFHHAATAANPTFDFYGNYFTIYSYDLPCVVKTGDHPTNDDNVSNGALFRFRTANTWEYGNDFDHKNFRISVNNVAFRDNDPNSNNQAESERHMRGLTCLKFSYSDVTVYNTNIDAFYVSMCAEDDDLTINVNDSKFYNAWQGHIFIWNKNYHHFTVHGWDEKIAGLYPETREAYQNIKININRSMLAKCGGPVILSQQADKNSMYNANSGADVVATDSVLYSYVTGQEAWFVAVGQTTMAGQILAMDQLVSGTANGIYQQMSAYGVPGAEIFKDVSYLSKTKINGVETMNLIMVNMGSGMGFEDLGYEGSFTRITTDGNGNVLSSVVGLNMHNPETEGDLSTTKNPQYYAYKSATGGQAPIFQTSNGGTSFGNIGTAQLPQPGLYYFDGQVPTLAPQNPEMYTGEYITMYYIGLGVMLEYYNSTNPASTPVVTPQEWLAK